jgi:hypothetical protein
MDSNLLIIETIYLIYMFFIFKTKYNFNSAVFEKETENIGFLFVHNTNVYENKICVFGKIMAIISIILAWFRFSELKRKPENYKMILIISIFYYIVCIILALLMNLNAFVYIIPLIIMEFIQVLQL